jgi:membrane protein DedA with SNARE-associated domain
LEREPGPPPETPGDAPAGRTPPSRWVLAAIVVPLIGLVIAAQVGDALAPTLVDTHPLVLIVLNARNRNLILVVNQIEPVWLFFVVGGLRLLVSDPLFYLLGWFYGDAAVRWLERRSVTARRYARDFERFFHKASYPLVFLAPNNPICLLAGSSGMRPAVFFALNISGTIARLWLILVLGETFEKPIDWVLDFIKEYRWYLLAVTVSIVAFTAWRESKTGSSELQQLRDLERELDAEEHEEGTG